MNVVIIDGQGGRIGACIIRKLIDSDCPANIIVVGTNSAATASMIKAGALQSATGENPVIVSSKTADIIVGPMGIIAANSLLGEITPSMAMAVSQSNAKKILIPMSCCGIIVAGVSDTLMKNYISEAVKLILKECMPE